MAMLLRPPPDCPWRIVFDGCIDKHAAASFLILSHRFSPRAFPQGASRKSAPSGTEGRHYSERETTPLSSIKHVFPDNLSVLYLDVFCFGGALRCFWSSGELKARGVGRPTSECACMHKHVNWPPRTVAGSEGRAAAGISVSQTTNNVMGQTGRSAPSVQSAGP